MGLKYLCGTSAELKTAEVFWCAEQFMTKRKEIALAYKAQEELLRNLKQQKFSSAQSNL